MSTSSTKVAPIRAGELEPKAHVRFVENVAPPVRRRGPIGTHKEPAGQRPGWPPALGRVLLALAVGLLLTQALMAAEGLDGNLIQVEWLKKNLQNPEVLILDVSPTQVHTAQHIPGAIGVFDPYNDIAYNSQDAPLAEMQELYRSWGVSAGKKVVIYDQGGDMMATRLFYSLYYHGFPEKNLFVLDGGLSKWQEQGAPLTKDATEVPKRGSFAIRVNGNAQAELPEFVTATGDLANNAIIEGLTPDWHFGELLVLNKAGHIPNATLVPYTDFYHSDKTFKSADEIRRMVTYFGIKPEQRIYTQCGGGVAGSVPFFALRFILKYPQVKLFRGSQVAWLSDQRDLPYWTYDAPFLMRDTSWLRWWGGQTIRSYGSAEVSIVDVRPADAFAQGHVPFALNIPADVFSSNITSPDKLAQILGRAGIHASDEAVVFSGAGLTKDSALAFAMLEKLGQKKVSVFMDSLATWMQRGLPVTKEPTVVAPRKSRHDLAIPPMLYPVALRQQVIITDPKSTHGFYPRIMIASGQKEPAKAQEGQVVHLPYTDLLNRDGTPKPAKDIWNILTKAGVPRYGELVCFSDDPGEAAANYFILKLMGYPDVKLLVN